MKAKRILSLTILITVTLLSGCSVKIANLTPATVPTNPSGIYTLSAKANIENEVIDRSSLAAFVVVDGQQFPMAVSDLGNGYYDFDYSIPEGRKNARFYYLVNYRLKNFTDTPGKLKEVRSPLHEFKLIDRYSITIDAERAPIGTQLAVLGRGFGPGDVVHVGNQATETRLVSTNALQFIVPALTPDNVYAVEVRSGKDVQPAGLLRIDPGIPLSVVPTSLDLAIGQRQALAFALDYPAPRGGLYLSVTTDIPSSIIMSEVFIPEGSRTVSATVEGGEIGKGMLYIKAKGLPEFVIPVTVR
jgi:hypothetical protein